MSAAAALLLGFAFGVPIGAGALYVVWRFAVSSPAYWLQVFSRVADVFPPGRWLRIGEAAICMHCPACGFSELSEVDVGKQPQP